MLRFVEYTDKEGRQWRRGLPPGAPDSQAASGVPMGPPSLKNLGLPLAVEVRLHNQLYARGIFSDKDARRNLTEVQAAVAAALRLDANAVLSIYEGAMNALSTTQ